jgi:hypothetical protein
VITIPLVIVLSANGINVHHQDAHRGIDGERVDEVSGRTFRNVGEGATWARFDKLVAVLEEVRRKIT